ncbi:PRC-barrel domain-containing protein [Limimaricola hongkongensis]|uniref:Hydrogenase maturation factor n=1 Tax=Limimaricola hongkongensis DSM 17492 TaxID=1122180 RepID=A0A017H841_9RHOB|nr:PRC-barrel domain-containing protein [Limimaricola hongkongensis]EYD70657.1 Hydrogenase maturation factor [Limimaricola hongkongensis DSM 17492]
MKRLLTTAATALVMGTGAYAESHSMGMGAYEVTADDFFATNMLGMRVHSSEQELGQNGDPIDFAEQEWDDIGEINDIILSEDGTVQAVIVGVGGFLGIGEKDVALTMDQVRTYDDANGERFLVINSSQEALESAPAFERASADGLAMTDGEAAEPGMVEDTGLSDATGTDTVTVPAAGETTTTEVETEMAEADAGMAETEMAEGEAEMVEGDMAEGEMVEAEADTEMAGDGGAMTGMVEREGYTTTNAADLGVDELTGATVYGADDGNVGEIEDLVAGEDGQVQQAVIGVGGFLGIGEKKVAVNFEDLQILTDETGADIRVYISATEDELKALPEYQAPEEAMETEPEAGMETGMETEMETETAPAAQ